MSYKIEDAGVRRLVDGVSIPNNPNNKDWIEYQKWLDEGNTPSARFNLMEAKALRIQETRREGLARITAVYSALGDVDIIDLVRDIILSIDPSARQVQDNLLFVQSIVQAARAIINEIRALTVVDDVLNYDVVSNPLWPIGS